MDPIEYTTPSGHKVFIKPKLTFGQFRQIARIQVSSYTLDPATKKMSYDGGSIYNAEDYAFKCLVTKIVDNTGKEYTSELLNVINEWDKVDGDYIYEKINEATKGSTITPELKKK